MYTILTLIIILLIIIFSIALYFNSKKSRQAQLDNGTCPQCNATYKSFRDENTGTYFKVDVIKTRIIKNHGCSGISEIEYRCNSCELKEIHTTIGQGGCSI
jgi:hypothetical protein